MGHALMEPQRPSPSGVAVLELRTSQRSLQLFRAKFPGGLQLRPEHSNRPNRNGTAGINAYLANPAPIPFLQLALSNRTFNAPDFPPVNRSGDNSGQRGTVVLPWEPNSFFR